MNQRQKIAYRYAEKHRLQFPWPMDLGHALQEHMTLLPHQKGCFQNVGDFMEEVNEELSILDGERGDNEQRRQQPATRRDHRAHRRV